MLAAGWTLGVEHPPGYPAVTLMLRLLALVPAGGPAFRLHLLAAGAMAAAGGVLAATARRITGRPVAAVLIAGWTMTLPPVWAQALEVKSAVYALHWLAVVAAGWLLAARGRPASVAGPAGPDRGWRAGAGLLAGVAAANHLHGGLVLAAALAVAVLADGPGRARAGGVAAAFALLGAGMLLYVPIRSAAAPAVCWGRGATLAGWMAAWRWAAGLFHAYNGRIDPAGWTALAGPLLVPALVAVAGNLAGWRFGAHGRLHAVVGAAAVIPAALFVRRDLSVGMIQYALPVCAGAGLGLAAITAAARPRWSAAAAVALLLLAPGSVVRAGAPDRSRFHLLDDRVRNLVTALPRDPALMVWLGDYDYDAARYRQLVLSERPDVAHVHGPILLTPAYGDALARLAREHPWLVLPAVRTAADPAALDRVLAALIAANAGRRPVLAPAYFLEEDWQWAALKALRPAVSGGLAVFSGPVSRPVPPARLTERIPAEPDPDRDRWAAAIRRQAAFAADAARDALR